MRQGLQSVQQTWARTNTSTVSGLFSMRVDPGAGSGRAGNPLQAWAYRSAAGFHAALQVGGLTAQSIQLPPCPPGVWATVSLSVSPAAGTLRAEVACDDGLGNFVATSEFPEGVGPLGANFTASAQLWLGIYGMTGELAGHASDQPMRGDNLAGFALYPQALEQGEMRAAMHDLLQPARIGMGGKLGMGGNTSCDAYIDEGCAPCAGCQRAAKDAALKGRSARLPTCNLLHPQHYMSSSLAQRAARMQLPTCM